MRADQVLGRCKIATQGFDAQLRSAQLFVQHPQCLAMIGGVALQAGDIAEHLLVALLRT